MFESTVIHEIDPGRSRDVCVTSVCAVQCVINVPPVGTGGRSRDVSVSDGYKEVDVDVVVSGKPVGASIVITVRSVCAVALIVRVPSEITGVSVNDIGPGIIVDVCVGTTIVVTLMDIACRGKT
jgi:hypothetical protein